MQEPSPSQLDLDRAKGLTIHWHDGTTSFYPIAYLRKMSPSADARHLREQMASSSLTVLPSAPSSEISAAAAELVGNYALKITFSDGHSSGIYSWSYLRSIDSQNPEPEPPPDPDEAQSP